MDAAVDALKAPLPESSQAPEGCAICLADVLTRRTTVEGCGHQFCEECVKKWAKARKSPCCPLCKNELAFLVLWDGRKEAVVKGAVNAEEADLDLACLDHSYFLGETNRLLRRAQSSQDAFYKDAFGFKQRGNRIAEQSYLVLTQVICSLKSQRSMLEQETAFDPHELIQELYNLDRIVQEAKSGTLDLANTVSDSSTVLYGADDADAIPDDEEDFYSEDIIDYSDYRAKTNRPNAQRPSKPHTQRSRKHKKTWNDI